MADTEHLRDAGRRLAQDLRALREARGIDIEILLETIRLPRDILEMFDMDALVDHPAFNRVYLRSIVSSYADVVGIKRSDALTALDETLGGVYSGSLGRKYLETPDEGIPETRDSEEDDSKIDFGPAASETGEASGTREEYDEAAGPGEESGEASGTREESDEAAGPGEESGEASGTREESDEAAREIQDSYEDDGISESEGEKETPPAPKAISWIQVDNGTRVLLPRKFGRIVAIAAVIVAVIIVWFIWIFSGFGEPEIPHPDTTAIDSVEVVREPEWIVLGDSMHFEVVAVEDVLNPIRITRDRMPRAPYYVEHGDTAHFFATDRIVFERRFILNRADVFLEGHLLSDSLIGADDRLVLTRQRAQRWLDSLAVQLAGL